MKGWTWCYIGLAVVSGLFALAQTGWSSGEDVAVMLIFVVLALWEEYR